MRFKQGQPVRYKNVRGEYIAARVTEDTHVAHDDERVPVRTDEGDLESLLVTPMAWELKERE